jgi:hypothetical protein
MPSRRPVLVVLPQRGVQRMDVEDLYQYYGDLPKAVEAFIYAGATRLLEDGVPMEAVRRMLTGAASRFDVASLWRTDEERDRVSAAIGRGVEQAIEDYTTLLRTGGSMSTIRLDASGELPGQSVDAAPRIERNNR